jgi:hypothetical protein
MKLTAFLGRNGRFQTLLSVFLALLISRISGLAQTPSQPTDVCVYGGTSAGVIAAVQVHKMGKSVVLVSPTRKLGGMTSSGLGFSDMGDARVLGGLARDYFHRIYLHYQQPDAWTFEQPAQFPAQGQGGLALDGGLQIARSFEPHVAEAVFDQLIAENHIPVVHARLDLAHGVTKDGNRIAALRTEDGRMFSARIFIDATYEGDLMAKAGVSYAVGREPNSQYGE